MDIIENFWLSLLSDDIIEPKMDNVKYETRFEGMQPKVYGLYLVLKDKEICYLISQEILDALPNVGVSHVAAMLYILDEMRAIRKPPKFNYIAGFFYDVGQQKLDSSVNSLINKNPNLVNGIAKNFEKDIFPKIHERFISTITQCQGKVKKENGRMCKRLVRKNLFCNHHDPNREIVDQLSDLKLKDTNPVDKTDWMCDDMAD